MSAAWLRIRSGLRSSVRPTLLLVVLIALGGACVLTAVTGARRTQTAMRRFSTYNRPQDVSLFFDPTPGLPAQVLRLPEVVDATRLPYMMVSTVPTRLGETGVFAAADANAFHAIDRPIVIEGRLADPNRADEAVVNERAAGQQGLRVGKRVPLYGFSLAQIAKVSRSGFLGTERPAGPRFSVHVVGIVRQPDDIAVVPVRQGTVYDSSGSLYTTPAFMRQYAASVKIPVAELPGNEIVRVRLRHGAADLHAFTADLNRVAGDHVQVLPGSDTQVTAAAVQRGLDVETVALLTFAALAAIAVVVLVGLNLSRLMRIAGADFPQLTALGMTRRQVLGVAVAWPLAAVVLGCIGAVGLTIAASPLTPVGVARQAETHPGVAVNVAVLSAAAAGLLLLLAADVLVGAIGMMRSATARRSRRSRSRANTAGDVMRGLGFGPVATLGVNAAWSRGPSSPFRRSAFVAVAIATTTVVAALIFGTSLDHLVSSPKQQGWTFDVVVGNVNDQNDQVARDVPLLRNNRYVAGFSAIATPPETPTIDGHSIGLAGIGELAGSVEPEVLAGRFVRAPDEIVLGRASLRTLHKHVGDRVTIAAGPRHMTARITGVVLEVSAGSEFSSRLDQGAATTLTGLKRLEPSAFVTIFFVRFVPHVDRAAALASIRHDFGPDMLQHVNAPDVENLARVDALPALLAALVALLATVTFAHHLFTSVSRRRRTLGTLKALGLDRSQLAGSVFWQTAAIAAAGIVIGTPVGVLLGRTIWRFVANQIGSVQPPVIPLAAIAASVAVAGVAVAVIAIGPAVQAARTRAAVVLRDE